MDFDTGWPGVVETALCHQRKGQGNFGLRGQGQPGQMELPRGDQRGHAAVHIVVDPRQGVLRRAEVTKSRMGM